MDYIQENVDYREYESQGVLEIEPGQRRRSCMRRDNARPSPTLPDPGV